MDSFLFALQFLSRLPVKRAEPAGLDSQAAAVSWFPVVGAIIGVFVVLFSGLLIEIIHLPALLSATLVVAFWVFITGGLHLDGLADCADAWMSCSPPGRMLEIMKDPACGAGAVIAMVLILAIKVAAVTALLENRQYLWLILPIISGRVMMVLVLMYLPYLRKKGLGKVLQDRLNHGRAKLSMALVCLLVLAIWPGAMMTALLAAFAGAVLVLFWIAKPLGGVTGDVYGAVTEVAEASALIGLTILLG